MMVFQVLLLKNLLQTLQHQAVDCEEDPEIRMEQEPVESQHIFATGCKKIKCAKTRTFHGRNFDGIAKEKFSIDFWLFHGGPKI